jgi:hypothetical protein
MKKCNTDTCSNKKWAKGLCQKCYDAVRAGRDPKEPTIFDKRPCIVGVDSAYLPLGVKAKQGYAIIDKKYMYLDKYNWHLSKSGYATRFQNDKVDFLHWHIVGKPESPYVTDHINRNKLDNRERNLRHIPSWENSMNKSSTGRKPSSGYKNIYWCSKTNKWRVILNLGRGIQKCVGYFNTIPEALKIRNEYYIKNKSGI